MTPSADVMPVVREWVWRDSMPQVPDAVQGHPDHWFGSPVENVVSEHNDLVAYAKALLQRAEKAEAMLRTLVDHCDGMESQHEDYHRMAEQGIPCRSAPLNDAIAYLNGAS